ncbi:uncharacterized protein BYT42DRAFT_564029 [Radiomyces spectabilis]|uniref:uncharacterized protein n=1 Tax=Radiomyces spectabilis TaxID=64574 RepID=UPI002220F5F8|nr:uncharacterized protein BYT42DRAFT_564029 [Radiomyces spectabilis]KAI8384909.1 hypothetical protein BYT42DRAFT_564029 [Radiomyces spectabilis]
MGPPNSVDMYYPSTSSSYHRRGSATSLMTASTSTVTLNLSPNKPSSPSSFRSFPHSRLSLSSHGPSLSKHDRKWRWWHYLSGVIFLLALLQLFALTTGFTLLNNQASSIRIAVRQYPSMPYRHLNLQSIMLSKATTVYHVTKEFGMATMGGMGLVVTALAAAQQKSGANQVSVVMPFYSFLKNKYEIERFVDLVIHIRDNKGNPVPVEFRVSKMIYLLNPSPAPTPAALGTNASADPSQVPSTPLPAPTEMIPVYLIGPGNRKPFSQAFRARKPQNIYSSPKGLPQDWRDQFFAKAAAAFLAYQATATDEESLFAPLRPTPSVDIVHLHGATNAYIAKLLADERAQEMLGAKPPALVYTMHDYHDELQYANTVANVRKFLDHADMDTVEPPSEYVLGHRMFMSRLGIDYADAVTIVSRTMAAAIVEGRQDFYLKELVMDSVLRKAEQARFYGISNGLDVAVLNPFTSQRLLDRKFAFPEYALDLIQQPSALSNVSIDLSRAEWSLSPLANDYVTTAKDRAKRFLVRRGILSEEDLKRPLVLFIGRFQSAHELDLFEKATQHFVTHDMRFVIMTQPNNYPLERIEALEMNYPDHVRVLSTAKEQRQFSIFCRAAADIAFVPSETESFGLVAAEGLLFGSSVLSTGAGGLGEFLTDRPAMANDDMTTTQRNVYIHRDKISKQTTITSYENYNAYLFDVSSLEMAIRDAALDFKRNSENKMLREEYVLRMIQSAMTLGWDRHQGPVDEYCRVYELALIDRKIPEIKKHEVEEERALLQRLLHRQV